MKKIIDGEKPSLPSDIEDSEDPNIQVIVESMEWCRQSNPEDRPSSKEVASRLMDALS
eukprot:CAMPEP_0119560790 /NCGR_PEP_ID=MMETSP1352-20130426/15893_1 /TAXON_ID=265584 /ORGANISM="Stauroneis constricta, Strain CCMP1120" /LENGTH=57 /DNA_ID=CAMNT_0007608843 /DNA_START=78 /DNA_END=248 /DNA_ORIENTATION=-